MIRRFRAWLSSLTEWPPTERCPMPDQDAGHPCTCRPAAVGERHETCGTCGGWVVYLSEHPTDTARREAMERPFGDPTQPMIEHRPDRPLRIADLAAMRDEVVDGLRDPDWDADDLPSTADPGVVTEKEE